MSATNVKDDVVIRTLTKTVRTLNQEILRLSKGSIDAQVEFDELELVLEEEILELQKHITDVENRYKAAYLAGWNQSKPNANADRAWLNYQATL